MARSARGTLRVKALFIGNSFNARNDLPGLVAHLAAAKGKTLEYSLISAGGASLRAHWNAGEALKAINTGNFDFVVLQEQSTLPVKNAARMHENIRLFDESINNVGSKTVLYMTWARRHAPETQAAITKAYNTIGRELGAMVVPVGVVWERFLRKHEIPVLHDRDLSHPTLAGSYLAACVFLAVLFNENPTGVDEEIAGLDHKHRVLLQESAENALRPVRRTSAD